MPTTTNDYQWTQESELEAQNGGKKKANQFEILLHCKLCAQLRNIL